MLRTVSAALHPRSSQARPGNQGPPRPEPQPANDAPVQAGRAQRVRFASGAARLWARRWWRLGIWATPVLALLAVTLPHMGDGDWQRGDSGFYTATGLQAWRTGELMTLRIEPTTPYFNKPPIAFWIVGLAAHTWGANAWTVRSTSVAAAVACVLLTGMIARDVAGRRAAGLSMVALALSMEFFRRTREVSLDLWQLVFLLGFVALAARAVVRGRPGTMLLAGILLGLALLTKPMVALASVPVVAMWIVLVRPRAQRANDDAGASVRPIGMLAALAGACVVALALGSSWYVAMLVLHGGEFWQQHVGQEIVRRAQGRLQSTSENPTTPAYYGLLLLRGGWPWLAAGMAMIPIALRERWRGPRGRLVMLWVLWLGLWLVLLSSFSDRRDRYALVLWPGIATLAGVWLAQLGSIRGRRWRTAVSRLWLASGPAMACLGLALAMLPIRTHRPIEPQWPEAIAFLRQAGLHERDGWPALGDGGTVWAGGWAQERAARVYHAFGVWARPTRSRWGTLLIDPRTQPEIGDLVLYHARDGLGPGPTERVVFDRGDVTIARVEQRGWQPVERSTAEGGSHASGQR